MGRRSGAVHPIAPPTGFGTVFKLSPPAAGMDQWQETVLYRFAGGSDGRNPISALQMDAAGRLYGTTLYGGKGPCTDWEGFVVGCDEFGAEL